MIDRWEQDDVVTAIDHANMIQSALILRPSTAEAEQNEVRNLPRAAEPLSRPNTMDEV